MNNKGADQTARMPKLLHQSEKLSTLFVVVFWGFFMNDTASNDNYQDAVSTLKTLCQQRMGGNIFFT